MEINVHPPLGPTVEFLLNKKEVVILESVLVKLLPAVEESKALGFRSKRRLNFKEEEFYNELTDKIQAIKEYVEKNSTSED